MELFLALFWSQAWKKIRETAQWFVRSLFHNVPNGDARVDEDNRPARTGSPEYYRERARSMLKLADEASSEETRVSFVLLAATWEELAKQLEHPGW